MAERLSALASLATADSDGAAVTLREIRAGAMAQAQAWPDTLDALRAALAETLGLAPPRLGEATTGDGVTIAATGPGRFFVATEDDGMPTRLAAAIGPDTGSVTDLTHGRTALRLAGTQAAELLGRCIAIDLDPAMLPPGRVAQTAIHHIDVLVHRTALDGFDLYAPRSLSLALTEWLLDAGQDLGVVLLR